MKIVMVVKNMRADSGVCSSVASISNALAQQGIDVYVASLSGRGPMEERLHIGVDRIIDLSQSRGLLFKSLSLRKLVKERRITVVHCHMHQAVMAGYLARALTKAQLAITEHSTLMPAKNWLTGFMENSIDAFIFRKTRIKIAVSRSVAATWAARTFTLPDAIDIIPNAIDSSVRGVRGSTVDRQMTPRRLLFLGRLAYEKNAMLALRIVSRLIAEGVDVSMQVAGSGVLDDKVRKEIYRLGLGDNIKLLGAVTNVSELFAQSDALLLTSFWEGCPMSILEAYANDVPVIATRVPGTMDVVDHLRTGVLIDLSLTSEDMENIKSLLVNPATIENLQGHIADKAKSFNSHLVACGYMKLYKKHLDYEPS